jgi:uncharacterized protein (DUF1697 family)
MPRYVALLRALNVGGHAVMTMSALRARLAPLELAELATIGTSGNLVITSRHRTATALARDLAGALAPRYTGRIFVRTPDELASAARGNPLAKDDEHVCHVVFLARAPAPDRRAALLALADDDYRFAIRGAVAYFGYPRAVAGKRRSIDLERVLGVEATARTWRVVDQLLAAV